MGKDNKPTMKEFEAIIHDIVRHLAFLELKKYRHHGGSRYAHSMEVAYTSYVVAKKLGYDVVLVTRAALMHDFFINDWDDYKLDRRFRNLPAFHHNLMASMNAEKYFLANEQEVEIIKSHMFPLVLYPFPRTKEAWLVSIVDKYEAIKDFGREFYFKFAVVSSNFVCSCVNK